MSSVLDPEDQSPSTPSRRVGRVSLHREIVAEIGTRIISGVYKPGDVLPNEAEFGAMLGISRSVMREAIKVLAAKGLVFSRTKVGTTISPRNHWNMLDPDVLRWWIAVGPTDEFARAMHEVRKAIEPAAAALAAQKARPKDIAQITEAFRAMAASVDDIATASQADLRFHLSILDATNNDILRSLGVVIETALASMIKIKNVRPGLFARTWHLHGPVLEAIRNHDPDAARHAMINLLDDVVDGEPVAPVRTARQKQKRARARSRRKASATAGIRRTKK